MHLFASTFRIGDFNMHIGIGTCICIIELVLTHATQQCDRSELSLVTKVDVACVFPSV